jgi:hypothetical protein
MSANKRPKLLEKDLKSKTGQTNQVLVLQLQAKPFSDSTCTLVQHILTTSQFAKVVRGLEKW